MAMLQSSVAFSVRVRHLGDEAESGGDSWPIGEAWGARWLWMRRGRPPVALGGTPNRERERARESREKG